MYVGICVNWCPSAFKKVKVFLPSTTVRASLVSMSVGLPRWEAKQEAKHTAHHVVGVGAGVG